jgi:alkylhydroperoxidase family enzyme
VEVRQKWPRGLYRKERLKITLKVNKVSKNEEELSMDRRTFVQTSVGTAVTSSNLAAFRLLDISISKSGVASDPLPLISIDEAARLGKKLGIERLFATSNVFRGLLNSPTATAGFFGLASTLLFHNKVADRTRELVILRVGWRTGSEYVFCQHVRASRELGMPDIEILGVRDPQRCQAYSETDVAVLRLADELHERAEVTRSTWAVLEKEFTSEELVELLLIGGFWRMAAGFLKSAKIQLDTGVPSWPEGRKPNNSVSD